MTIPKNWSEEDTHTHTRFLVLVCTLSHACGELRKLSKDRGGALWGWVGEMCFGVTCYVEGGVIARGARC